MSQESSITIQLVHGGYVLRTPADEGHKTEVFTSTAKLVKAVRGAIDEFTLVAKKSADKDDAEE